MKIHSTHLGPCALRGPVLCAMMLVAVPAVAQNQRYYPQTPAYPQQQPQYNQPPPNSQPPPGYGYGYPQQPQTRYESPIEFLPKFGRRMSEMFRRLFYGQEPAGWDNPPPGYNPNGSYNLDSNPRQYQAPSTQPPPGYYPQQPGYQYPQQGQTQPRYSYPPQQPPPASTNRSTTPAPSTQGKSSSRTYTPPKVSSQPSKTPSSKTPSSKPTTPTHSPPKEPESPPPNTTARRSESTPKEPPPAASSGSSGSFLKGRKTGKPGRVISPYPPYKELDVTGLESGSLALDPTTQKVFEVP